MIDRATERSTVPAVRVFTPGDSGIIDQNVEFRELFPDAGREGIDGLRIFNVELHTAHAGVGGGDLVEESLTAAGDDDLIAALMESLGKGAADTAGAASDEDGVASETHRSFLLSRCPANRSSRPRLENILFLISPPPAFARFHIMPELPADLFV
jgi:hypothetical protein